MPDGPIRPAIGAWPIWLGGLLWGAAGLDAEAAGLLVCASCTACAAAADPRKRQPMSAAEARVRRIERLRSKKIQRAMGLDVPIGKPKVGYGALRLGQQSTGAKVRVRAQLLFM